MIAFILYQLIRIFIWAVVIHVILSWLIGFGVINRHNRFADAVWRALTALTEPVMGPVRRVIPPIGGLDLSPLVVIIGLQAINGYILFPLMT